MTVTFLNHKNRTSALLILIIRLTRLTNVLHRVTQSAVKAKPFHGQQNLSDPESHCISSETKSICTGHPVSIKNRKCPYDTSY